MHEAATILVLVKQREEVGVIRTQKLWGGSHIVGTQTFGGGALTEWCWYPWEVQWGVRKETGNWNQLLLYMWMPGWVTAMGVTLVGSGSDQFPSSNLPESLYLSLLVECNRAPVGKAEKWFAGSLRHYKLGYKKVDVKLRDNSLITSTTVCKR